MRIWACSAAVAKEATFSLYPSASSTAADIPYGDTNTTTVGTINSTTQLFLQITFAYSAASTGSSASQRHGIVEVLNQ